MATISQSRIDFFQLVALDQNNDDRALKKLSEYAVHLEDLKATLFYYVDSDDFSTVQQETVPNVVDVWDS